MGKPPPYGMDTDSMKGQYALVTVIHKTSNSGKSYPVMDSVVPLPKAMLQMLHPATPAAKTAAPAVKPAAKVATPPPAPMVEVEDTDSVPF